MEKKSKVIKKVIVLETAWAEDRKYIGAALNLLKEEDKWNWSVCSDGKCYSIIVRKYIDATELNKVLV